MISFTTTDRRRRVRLALPRIAPTIHLLAAAVLTLTWCGCSHRPASAPSVKAGSITELHLLSMPVAVNLDAQPGADGFAIKIYAVGPGNPKPVAIGKGSLEILMYDGAIGGVKTNELKPRHTWTFSSDLLKAHLFRTTIGLGYSFTLAWQEDQPTQNRITVVARYLPVTGEPVASSPSSLSVAFTGPK